MSDTVPALLLMGPTGSGKTPQGRLLERRGHGVHFDFGHELRRAAKDGTIPAADAALVRRLLNTHALFPEERFDVAAAILHAFIDRTRAGTGSARLILNGLPRHVAQARDMEDLSDVRHVVVLDCDPETVRRRIAQRGCGVGLDHVGRDDDHPDAVARKLRVYAEETAPVVGYYLERPGTDVLRLTVAPDTGDESIHARIVAHVERDHGAHE